MGSFCSECWLKRNELFELKNFDAVICECGSLRSGGKWEKFSDIRDALEREIKKRIKTSGKIRSVSVDFHFSGNLAKARVKCTGLLSRCKKTKEQEKNIVIILRKSKCEDCKKECASYYEAVMQLRAPEMIEKVLKLGGASVISVKEVRGGFDIFFRSNELAKSLCAKLQKKGFSVVRSGVYLARKNNKNIYRNYYSVKDGKNG